MRRHRAFAGLALAAVAGVSALAVVLAAWDRGGDRAAARPVEPVPALEARGVLSPRIALFGDTVRVRVDVTLDRSRIDPGSVRVTADFSPWASVEKPERVRLDAGHGATHVRTTFVLRCLTGPCAPPRETAPLEFDPARVTYDGRGEGRARRGSSEARWPVLVVHTRLQSADFERSDAPAGPWRADALSLPAVSYRVAPGLVLALLLAGGALLASGGAVLSYLVWPRRAPAPAPGPEAAPEPTLTPLEHALALLESPVRADGAAAQRRALELVAEELARRDDRDLAQAARELAWSEVDPAVEETSGLSARVRSALEEASHGQPA